MIFPTSIARPPAIVLKGNPAVLQFMRVRLSVNSFNEPGHGRHEGCPLDGGIVSVGLLLRL